MAPLCLSIEPCCLTQPICLTLPVCLVLLICFPGLCCLITCSPYSYASPACAPVTCLPACLQVTEYDKGQDWSVCQNGEKHPGAVKQAVDDFATEQFLSVFVTYHDQPWNTWFILKPEA